MLHHRPQAERKQGLLRVAQQIDHAMFGIAKKDALTIREQVELAVVGGEIRQAMAEIAAEDGDHPADALQAETSAAEVAQDAEFGYIFGGVNAAMAFAGGHHNSLLVPPLQLAWRKPGVLGNLAGCEVLAYAFHQIRTLGVPRKNRQQHSSAICLKQNRPKMLSPWYEDGRRCQAHSGWE